MDLIISEFTGEVQRRILDNMNQEYLSSGKFVKDQMNVSPKILSSLMVSGGVAGISASAKLSPSLFMATANPTTLMSIGSGVGSAVTGTKGIVAQAPFIPVANSIPVVAPLMFMQVLSSVVMLQQFGVIDEKLDVIKGAIDKMLARQEVTKVAELLAAIHIVDEIYLQYSITGCFSTDMLARLALAEHDSMVLSGRYEILENFNTSGSNENDFATNDTYLAMLSSFLNLRVKYLRTCVDIQENPQYVQYSSGNFTTLLKDSIELWDQLLHKSDQMKTDIEQIAAKLEGAKGPQKFLQMSKEKELSRKKDSYTATMEKERIILNDFHALMDTAKQMTEPADAKTLPTLLYWRDEEGEHCIATNEQIQDMIGSMIDS